VQTTVDAEHDTSTASRVLLIAGIILIAANLRGALTMVGPLLEMIRGETNLSAGEAGLLPALPLLTFAVVSPLVSRVARRMGIERTLWGALLVLAAGILLRSLPAMPMLWVGTALLGTAIAFGNVLLPSLIKRDFPHRVGMMTGVYSTVMGGVGAIASGVAVPLAVALPGGWRTAFGCLAGLALIAAGLWLPQLSERSRPAVSGQGMAGAPWRSALAWQVTAFMGLQSSVFYITLSWLPAILREHGASEESAGWLLFLAQLLGVAVSMLVPLLAGRLADQRLPVAVGALLGLFGYLGLLVAPDLMVLWAVVIGLSTGTSFVLALSFLSLRAADSHQAASLSGMAQSCGYLLATTGPIVFGALHDASHGWTVPLIVLIGIVTAQGVVGVGAGRAAHI
jgi:CP family cyanate transporter-like MFS transporter